ncbi:type VI secretion system-associated FHA domain protein TagH, partial [Sphingomonas immobilis]
PGQRPPQAPPRQAAPPPPPSAPPAPPPQAAPAVPADAFVAAFVKATGVEPGQVKDMSPATLDRAGQLFRRLVAGLVVMIEARARAKSQMGAESTSFSMDGNNPIKFARTPEEAMAALLNPSVRGFMEAGAAIDDAYFDLQSHQIATLKAMQGALRSTLDRFSPTAIKKRAETGGLMSKIMPGAKEAALWQAYEKEFGGVAQGSDEAFMDVFAKEFRKAYDEQNHKRGK